MSQVTYTKILALGLEKRVLLWLGSLACTKGGSSGLLAGSSLGFGRLVIETKSAIAYNNATRSSSAYFHTPSINAREKKGNKFRIVCKSIQLGSPTIHRKNGFIHVYYR